MNLEFQISQKVGSHEDINSVCIDKFTVTVDKTILFDETKLLLTKGKRYGLIGRNGCGKSTILNLIATSQFKFSNDIDTLLLEQDLVSHYINETVLTVVMNSNTEIINLLLEADLINAKDIDSLSEIDLDRLQIIHEELASLNADNLESKARHILFGLGFNHTMQTTSIKTLSGGWRMRVALAKILYMEPSLLLLDEPSNHLDLNAVIWLTDYLSHWKKMLIIVSHDQTILDSCCTDIINVENKKLVYYTGNWSKFKHIYLKNVDTQIKKYEKLKKNVNKGVETKKQLKISRPDKEYTVEFQLHDPKRELQGSIITLTDGSFSYEKDQVVIKDVNMLICQNSRIGIIGQNGSGKTTLLNLISGSLKPTKGSCEYIDLKIGYYSQYFIDQLELESTPVEFLQKQQPHLSLQETRKILGQFGLPSLTHISKIKNLSGGQKARVLLAYLANVKANILILDEPTNHLDIESIDALISSINKYKGAVVVVSHDARLLESINCELWVCSENHVKKFDGDFSEYKSSVLEDIENKN